jgi:hypothetical protein
VNQLFVNNISNHNSICSDPMTAAEHELAALFSAVKKSFGSEDAGSEQKTGWTSWRQ